jgi:hypothetical protein
MSEFTIGVDPEYFVLKGTQPVSAHDLIPGDKKNPYPVEGGAIQADGTAAEFNTDPVPYADFDAFNAKIVTVVKNLKTELAKAGRYNLNISPVQEYSQEYFDSLPKEAKELGCDPDYCAYTLEKNPRPEGDRLFRTGAGHIHVGWGANIPTDNEEHHEICASFVKMLDASIGLFMTVIDRDPRRRELYGKAGAYRAKPYGVEYRFPSNVWLTSRARRKVVHSLLVNAIQRMKMGYSVEKWSGLREEDIRNTLNNGDHAFAKKFVRGLSNEAYRYFQSAEYQKDFPNG